MAIPSSEVAVQIIKKYGLQFDMATTRKILPSGMAMTYLRKMRYPSLGK